MENWQIDADVRSTASMQFTIRAVTDSIRGWQSLGVKVEFYDSVSRFSAQGSVFKKHVPLNCLTIAYY